MKHENYAVTYEMVNGMRIHVRPTPNADTRSCGDPTKVTRAQLLEASQEHKRNIVDALNLFATLANLSGLNHDMDKLRDLDGFHANFQTGFKERDWLDRHYEKNRHHLENPDAIPEDVNLIDVLDHIADQVTASESRGFVRPVDLSPELLQRAVANTEKLLRDRIVVVKDKP